MGKYRKFTPEYRDEAVKMVLESDQPIARVARELGINEGTLAGVERGRSKASWVSILILNPPPAGCRGSSLCKLSFKCFIPGALHFR